MKKQVYYVIVTYGNTWRGARTVAIERMTDIDFSSGLLTEFKGVPLILIPRSLYDCGT